MTQWLQIHSCKGVRQLFLGHYYPALSPSRRASTELSGLRMGAMGASSDLAGLQARPSRIDLVLSCFIGGCWLCTLPLVASRSHCGMAFLWFAEAE